jgi:hypothetical protein
MTFPSASKAAGEPTGMEFSMRFWADGAQAEFLDSPRDNPITTGEIETAPIGDGFHDLRSACGLHDVGRRRARSLRGGQ